jgi:predicted dehydrogenase
MLRHVSGDPIVQVGAEMATLSGEAIDVEDVIAVTFTTQSGAVGSMHLGYMLAQSGEGYFNSDYEAYIGFRGRLGRTYWNPMTRRPPQLFAESTHTLWAAAPIRQFDYTLGESGAYGGKMGEAFVRQFLAACWGEATPPTTIDDALYVARVTHAVYEAAQTGRRVLVAG